MVGSTGWISRDGTIRCPFRNGRVGDGAGMVWQKVPDAMEIALDPHEEAAEEVVQGLDEALRALGISRISPPGNTWFLIQADDLTAERAQKTDVMDPSFFVGLDDVSVREMSLSLLDILRLAVARARLTVLQMIGFAEIKVLSLPLIVLALVVPTR